jgi:phosphatidylglycerol---prolipoprotein diacylglyceryl transferase
MHPVLFKVGSILIYSYGSLLSLGVAAGLFIACQHASGTGRDPKQVLRTGTYLILSGFIGAKLWGLIANWALYAKYPNFMLTAGFLRSGGTFYGGMLGTLPMAVLYGLRHRKDALSFSDSAALGLSFGHAVGRLGCFAAGCCYGKPTSLPWAVIFTNNLAYELVGTPTHIPLHPTQLYEFACELANFAILLWIGKTQRFNGQLMSAWLIMYGMERLIIEFWRGDPGRTMMFGDSLSLMQLVSIAFLVTGSAFWLRQSDAMSLAR